MNGLDLFSGIGGISSALAPWVRPIAYCENDRYAQSVLLSRMRFGDLEAAPIWDDVCTLTKETLPVLPDIIYGGFPCQDISTAGRGEGLEGERSGLFFEVLRLCCDIRPPFVFLENVPAISVRGLERILLEFSALGYDCRWTIVSAREIGAPHIRERWFLLAHPHGESVRLSESEQWEETIDATRALEARNDPNSARIRLEASNVSWESEDRFSLASLEGNDWDEYARFLLRVDHGISHRGHRIRSLGNAVVPAQAREAFQRLMGFV